MAKLTSLSGSNNHVAVCIAVQSDKRLCITVNQSPLMHRRAKKDISGLWRQT